MTQVDARRPFALRCDVFIRLGGFAPLRCGLGARGYPHTETRSLIFLMHTQTPCTMRRMGIVNFVFRVVLRWKVQKWPVLGKIERDSKPTFM